MIKTAVVTGASYGLGKSVSEKLVAAGYKVYGISRSKPEITSEKFCWIQTDLTKDSDIQKIPSAIIESKIDILINNAGWVFPLRTLDYTDEAFEKMFSLNFKAHAKLTPLLFPKLDRGLIFITSSDSDRAPDPELALYGATKAALNIYFETMAQEYKNVKIISFLPTYMDTPFLRKFLEHDKTFDWSRALQPDDVADVMMHVVTNRNDFESGSRIMILTKPRANGVYNQEKLWVYTTENKKLEKHYK